jgi:hypothetical protein
VARSAQALSERDVKIEVVALAMFNAKEPRTRCYVEERLMLWRSHPPRCRCGQPCHFARAVSVSQIWSVLWAWQQSIHRTRALAAR